MQDLIEFGKRLKAAIQASPYKQGQLADFLSVHQNMVSLYVRGQTGPDIPKLKKIGEYLGVDLNWLITGVGGNAAADTGLSTADTSVGAIEASSVTADKSGAVVRDAGVQFLEPTMPQKLAALTAHHRATIEELVALYYKEDFQGARK